MTYENDLIKARQKNLDRYCRLLATPLTDLEREYLHSRIAEEKRELERLTQPYEHADPIKDMLPDQWRRPPKRGVNSTGACVMSNDCLRRNPEDDSEHQWG